MDMVVIYTSLFLFSNLCDILKRKCSRRSNGNVFAAIRRKKVEEMEELAVLEKRE
jgi:hypothetical protein